MSFKTLIIRAVFVALVFVGSIAAIRLLATRIDTKQDASIKLAQRQIDLFDNDLQFYAMDMDEFPSQSAALAALKSVPQDAKRPNQWAGPYHKKDIPLDPWGHAYHYQFPGPRHANIKPDVWSSGPDGESGTSDDILNK